MPRVHSSIEGTAAEAFDNELRSLDIDGLRQQWRNRSGKAAGLGLTRSLLLRAISYQRQVERVGDLSSVIGRMLARLVEEAGRADDENAVAKVAKAAGVNRAFLPGTILVREWHGVPHYVTVMKDSFAWNGTTNTSLSRVAREITGSAGTGTSLLGNIESGRGSERACRDTESEQQSTLIPLD